MGARVAQVIAPCTWMLLTSNWLFWLTTVRMKVNGCV